jgi:hypothetical protein
MYFCVIKLPIIWEPSLQPLEVTHDNQLCHAYIIKICIINYCIHSTGLHVIPKPCYIQSKRIYIEGVSEGIVNILGGGSIDYSNK